MSWIIWIIIAIIVDILYHKMFDVIYFSGKGFIREIIGVIIVSAIIYAVLLYGFAKITGKVPEKKKATQRESIVYESEVDNTDNIYADEEDKQLSDENQPTKYLNENDPLEVFMEGMVADEVKNLLGEPDYIGDGNYYYNTIGYGKYVGKLIVFLNRNSYNDRPIELSGIGWSAVCDNSDDAINEARRLVELYTDKYCEPERTYDETNGMEIFDFYINDYLSLHVTITDDKTCELSFGIGIKSEYYIQKEQPSSVEANDVDTESNSNDIDEEIEDNSYADDISEDVNNEYIFPESDIYEIYESELEDLSSWELRLARNEILARYGRKFSDQELQEYFNSCSWYEGTIDPEDFDINVLNEIEKNNIDLIKNEESTRK